MEEKPKKKMRIWVDGDLKLQENMLRLHKEHMDILHKIDVSGCDDDQPKLNLVFPDGQGPLLAIGGEDKAGINVRRISLDEILGSGPEFLPLSNPGQMRSVFSTNIYPDRLVRYFIEQMGDDCIMINDSKSVPVFIFKSPVDNSEEIFIAVIYGSTIYVDRPCSKLGEMLEFAKINFSSLQIKKASPLEAEILLRETETYLLEDAKETKMRAIKRKKPKVMTVKKALRG